MLLFILEKERALMRKHIKEVGIAKILLTYFFILMLVILIEAFASYNIFMIKDIHAEVPLLREIFSAMAIIIAAFTIIANMVFLGGRSRADKEFHYYFRTRPLLLFSGTAVIGDIFAIFYAGNATYPFIVFFTSLIALNIFTAGFAIHATEKALSK